jgi:hypothetical protein
MRHDDLALNDFCAVTPSSPTGRYPSTFGTEEPRSLVTFVPVYPTSLRHTPQHTVHIEVWWFSLEYVIDSLLMYVGFEVYTAVFMKSIIFWYVTPCSPLSCNRRFGGTYPLNLQGPP